eukprot:scaffold86546_cov35-Tisochrysis_lutea.AAC.2
MSARRAGPMLASVNPAFLYIGKAHLSMCCFLEFQRSKFWGIWPEEETLRFGSIRSVSNGGRHGR